MDLSREYFLLFYETSLLILHFLFFLNEGTLVCVCVSVEGTVFFTY